jgi:hypothetical protein
MHWLIARHSVIAHFRRDNFIRLLIDAEGIPGLKGVIHRRFPDAKSR